MIALGVKPDGNLVPPPKLARNAPGFDIFQPMEIHFFILLWQDFTDLPLGDTQESIDICMKVIKIHGFGTKENIWTTCLFPAMLRLCLAYYTLGETKMGQLWLEKLRAELSITATGDDRVFVEEHREGFEKFGIKL